MHRLDTFPADRELLQRYRNVFGSKEGPVVLAHILFELGLFNDDGDRGPEDVALKTYAARLLNILGAGEVKQDTIETFVRRLMAQPLPEPKKEYGGSYE